MTACEKQEVDPNVPTEFTVETAKELLRQDEIITKIFVCNGLCGEEDVLDYVEVSEESQYSSFEELTKLLDTTYLPESGIKDFYLNYPEIGDNSVIEREGKTFVFKHPGSGYNDFLDLETVSVTDTEDEAMKIISAKTESGRELTFNAVYSEQKWLLKETVFASAEEEKFNVDFVNAELGSLSKFSGNVLVIKFFISDLRTSFTDEEEAIFGEKIETSVNFIKDEAKRYGNNVHVTYSSAYFKHSGFITDRIIDFDADFAETGFGTLRKFAEANYDLTQYDNYFFVVCFNKELETSFECYEGTKETAHYFGERVCIGTNATEHEICVSVLSLLGAVNFENELCGDYLKSLHKYYFPNDVFYKETLEGAMISPFNAYVIGIKKDLERIYRVFNYEK
jgi:hypothetical protein